MSSGDHPNLPQRYQCACGEIWNINQVPHDGQPCPMGDDVRQKEAELRRQYPRPLILDLQAREARERHQPLLARFGRWLWERAERRRR